VNLNALASIGDELPNMGKKISSIASTAKSITSTAKALSSGDAGFEYGGYHWAGMQKSELVSHYKSLKALGIQHKEYYVVRFRPYRENKTKDIDLLSNVLSGWLATSVNLQLLQAETDSKKAGAFMLNFLTGKQATPITINMIETEGNLVTNSITKLASLMFKPDGTYGLPADYSFWVEVMLYSRANGRANYESGFKSLVYPTDVALDLDSADHSALTIPITLTPSRTFMTL
jgi:hypothetical protein